jgi:hypothetical protein
MTSQTTATHATLVKLFTLAADRAATLKGLKGAARRQAEYARSCAISVERVRCNGMTEDQALARLIEVSAQVG